MAELKELLGSLMGTKNWCVGNVTPLISKPVEDIYEGTKAPAMWCVVLAYTNLPVAKTVLETAIHNAANTLEEGELKTRMLAFNAAMAIQELDELMTWAEPLRRTQVGFPPLQVGPSKVLCSALFAAAKVLKYEVPELMLRPVNDLVAYKASSEGKSWTTAVAEFYDFLHGEVSLAAWKGSYT